MHPISGYLNDKHGQLRSRIPLLQTMAHAWRNAYKDRTCKPNRSQKFAGSPHQQCWLQRGAPIRSLLRSISSICTRNFNLLHAFPLHSGETLESAWQGNGKEGQAPPCRNLNVQPKSPIYLDLARALMCSGNISKFLDLYMQADWNLPIGLSVVCIQTGGRLSCPMGPTATWVGPIPIRPTRARFLFPYLS